MKNGETNEQECLGAKSAKSTQKKHKMWIRILFIILLLGIGIMVALYVKRSNSEDSFCRMDYYESVGIYGGCLTQRTYYAASPGTQFTGSGMLLYVLGEGI